MCKIRDESFISSWGAPVIFRGGVGKFFGDVLGGGENKMTYGQGGVMYFVRNWGGGGQMCSIGLSFH